jgi:hypothetical protein
LPISRRGFWKFLLVATGGAAVAAVGLRGSLRGLSHQLANPTLAKTAIGPLSGHTVTTLLATTEAFLGSPIEKAHYEDFFRWHAETLAGNRALYERLAATVNQAAQKAHGCVARGGVRCVAGDPSRARAIHGTAPRESQVTATPLRGRGREVL